MGVLTQFGMGTDTLFVCTALGTDSYLRVLWVGLLIHEYCVPYMGVLIHDWGVPYNRLLIQVSSMLFLGVLIHFSCVR